MATQNQTPTPAPQASTAYVPKVAPTYDVDIASKLEAELISAENELAELMKSLPAEQQVVLKGKQKTHNETTNTVYPPPGSTNQQPSVNTTTSTTKSAGDQLSGVGQMGQRKLQRITFLEGEVARLKGLTDPKVLAQNHPPTQQQLLTHYVGEATGQTATSGPNIDRLAGRLGDVEQGTSLDNIALRKALTNPALEGSFGGFGRLLASVFNKNDPALMADYIRILNEQYGTQLPGPGGTQVNKPLYGAGLRPGYEMKPAGAELIPETQPGAKPLATAAGGERVAGQVAAEGTQPIDIPRTARDRVRGVNRAAGQGVQQLDTLVAGARAQIDKNRKLTAVGAAGTAVATAGTATALALKKGEYDELSKQSTKAVFGVTSPSTLVAKGWPADDTTESGDLTEKQKGAFSHEMGRITEDYARGIWKDDAKREVYDAISRDHEELMESLGDGRINPNDLDKPTKEMIFGLWNTLGAPAGKPLIFPVFDANGYQTGLVGLEQGKTPDDPPRVVRFSKGKFEPIED